MIKMFYNSDNYYLTTIKYLAIVLKFVTDKRWYTYIVQKEYQSGLIMSENVARIGKLKSNIMGLVRGGGLGRGGGGDGGGKGGEDGGGGDGGRGRGGGDGRRGGGDGGRRRGRGGGDGGG